VIPILPRNKSEARLRFLKYIKSPQFFAGDMGRIESRKTIAKIIQSEDKLYGCLFMEQIWDNYGNTYTELKVVDHFFNEQHKKIIRPRAPLYLLEKIICNGSQASFRLNATTAVLYSGTRIDWRRLNERTICYNKGFGRR